MTSSSEMGMLIEKVAKAICRYSCRQIAFLTAGSSVVPDGVIEQRYQGAQDHFQDIARVALEASDRSALLSRIEELEGKMKQIEQRANETETGPLAWQETVFAIHAIARSALAAKSGG